MRLNAYLARAGVSSRRGADDLIRAGRVTVNGQRADLAAFVERWDRVELDGAVLAPEPLVHVLLHKPAGVVTTARDPHGRPTVVGVVGHEVRIVPVGRLDADTTGALVLTNDGQLAHHLAHPRYGVEKVYEADVEGVPSRSTLARLGAGVILDDSGEGRRTAPARARLIRRWNGGARVELALHEGRKHQVKRMLATVGHPVVRLHRSRYAELGVEGLAPGEWRPLSAGEVAALRRLVRA
jgi:23S rRNA pseudouridine2605 synthase